MRQLAVLIAVGLAGCTHWKRDDTVLLQPIPEREQVEINASGMRVVGVGVRVDSLNVSYVKYFQDPACDSCRALIPRASIDSVRVSALSPSRNIILVVAIFVIGRILSQLPTD
jgi:hypothetical protein